MGLLLKAAKLALLLGLSAAADDALSTCGGLKSAYKSAQCCGSKGKKALDQQYEPLKRAHVPRADYNETSGDYDFVMAGSGTGGLGLAGKLASVAEDHPDFRMLIVEAGRWLEPSLLRLPFTLTRSWADGTVRVEHHTKQLPVNWVAAVDNWLRAYEMAGTTAPGPRPANFFFETYTYLLTSPDYMSFVSTLRGHLKTVVDDPNNSQQILAEDLPNVTIQLIESNASNTGVVQPNMDAADSTTFEGNPLVLLDPVWLEIRRNQLIAGYGTSEDIFYHDAFYSTSTSGYLQNYPRGKTLGGSSVVNAGVHYGLTDKVLDQLADLSGNSEFSSAHTANIVKGSVTLTSQCSDWSSPLPNECRGPVYGWNTQDYDDMAPIEHRKMLGDTPGVYPDITYSQVADEFYKRSKQPHDKTISSADFEEAKREKARSATESINPFSKIRSTSADALVNLLARGIKVCFYASSNPLVLSKRVLPAKYDCDVHPESPVHIRTGAFVTEIEFDPNDPKRATGLRWVNEHEQYQPDQNRFYREKDASCDVAKSLYGVGENNSADCDNRLYYFEMLNANPNVTSEQKTEMAQRAAIATQELLTDGKKNHPGRGANYQFLEPESQKTLRPAVNEHVETAKKEVILALGAPATTAMLMRSGISTKEDSQRLGTHLRSELEVGAMNDNYEGFYTLATPNVAVATKWCQDIFDMQARGQGTIQSSYLTGDDADPREPLSKNIHPDGFYLRFRNTADGDYHMNLHMTRAFFSTMGSSLYTIRHGGAGQLTFFNGGFPMCGPAIFPETCGGTDVRKRTVKLHIDSVNPFEKIKWDITHMSRERCQVFKNVFDEFIDIMKELEPTNHYEFLSLTERKTDFLMFSEPMASTSGAPFGTAGSRNIGPSELQAYFNDTSNPVIGGYRYTGKDNADQTDMDQFCSLLMKRMSGHHIMGGAIMGPADEPSAVTDGHGRVYGMKGLRVTDISLFPVSPNGNPWVATYQLGSILGNWVPKEWGYTTSNATLNAKADPSLPSHPYFNAKTAEILGWN